MMDALNIGDAFDESENLDATDWNSEEEELFEHYRFEADSGQKPLRVDKFLMNFVENTSRNKIQAAADAGSSHVNGKAVKSNHRVKGGDVVTVVMSHPPREIELIPQDIPLNICYEDEHVIVLNKEAGMVVHPGYGNYRDTLVNALVFHFEQLPDYNGVDRPGLVHRLDKNTSGIMLIARNERAMTHLAKQFFDSTTDRQYEALVWGDFDEDEGVIEGHIGRSLKNRKGMDVFEDGSYGKHAVTRYKVLERFGYVTRVVCKLETGRTHQIRAHFKHIGHPLFNDETYGGNEILKGTTFTKYKQFVQNAFALCPRHALHAKTLAFDHPATGERMSFSSELPQDMADLIEKWRNYARHQMG